MTGLGEQGWRVRLRSWDRSPLVRRCCFHASAFPGAQHSGFCPMYRFDTEGVRAFHFLQPRPCGQELGNSSAWSARSCRASTNWAPSCTGPCYAGQSGGAAFVQRASLLSGNGVR